MGHFRQRVIEKLAVWPPPGGLGPLVKPLSKDPAEAFRKLMVKLQQQTPPVKYTSVGGKLVPVSPSRKPGGIATNLVNEAKHQKLLKALAEIKNQNLSTVQS